MCRATRRAALGSDSHWPGSRCSGTDRTVARAAGRGTTGGPAPRSSTRSRRAGDAGAGTTDTAGPLPLLDDEANAPIDGGRRSARRAGGGRALPRPGAGGTGARGDRGADAAARRGDGARGPRSAGGIGGGAGALDGDPAPADRPATDRGAAPRPR